MNLKLRFEFNSLVNEGFTIENPPTLPCEGEIVNVRWEDYISDKEAIATLNKYRENDVFLANILSRSYSKDLVEVVVVLFEEADYYEEFELAKEE